MRRAPLVAALSLALLAVAPAPARGADDPATRKKVQAYLDLAASLFKDGDLEGALAELRRAEALSDLAVVRFNVARCLDDLKRPAEAVTAYQKYLDLHDTSDGATEREKRARDAMVRLGQPGAAAATTSSGALGSLEINCPADGTVLIAGLAPAPVPCPYKNDHVAPGIYDVQVARRGRPTVAARAQVNAGLATAVPFEALVPLPDSQQPAQPQPARANPNTTVPTGLVSVRFVAANQNDEMRVKIDDNESLQCQAPCEMMLQPGHHRVEFYGDVSYIDHVDTPTGGPVVAKVTRRKGGWVAVGAISVVTGALMACGGLIYATGISGGGTDEYGDPIPANGSQVVPGLIFAGAGVVIGVGGGLLGFLMAGHNQIDLEAAASQKAEGEAPRLQLVSAGIIPTRGGAVAGVGFAF